MHTKKKKKKKKKMSNSFVELMSEATELLEMFAADGFCEKLAVKKISGLLARILKFGANNESVQKKQPPQKQQPKQQQQQLKQQQQQPKQQQQQQQTPQPANKPQHNEEAKEPTQPSWKVHESFFYFDEVLERKTVKFDIAVDYKVTPENGFVFVNNREQYEVVKSEKMKLKDRVTSKNVMFSWAALSKRSIDPSSEKRTLPAINKDGSAGFRTCYVTHICGKRADRQEVSEDMKYRTNPVIVINDWSKSTRDQLVAKSKEKLEGISKSLDLFNFKTAESHSSMCLRLNQTLVKKVLSLNGTSEFLFFTLPSWSNGDEKWPSIHFKTNNYLEAKYTAQSAKGCGDFYLARFKTCFGLRAHPSAQSDIRFRLGNKVQPPLPAGERYQVEARGLLKYSRDQISDILQLDWKHTTVSSFVKGNSRMLIVHSVYKPPTYVAMGDDKYLVIRCLTKKTKAKTVKANGPTFFPTFANQNAQKAPVPTAGMSVDEQIMMQLDSFEGDPNGNLSGMSNIDWCDEDEMN